MVLWSDLWLVAESLMLTSLPRDAVDALSLEVPKATDWGPRQPDLVVGSQPRAGFGIG